MTNRRSADRGRANFGWLDSRHTFSFGHYYDPTHMGFGPLRVINEDGSPAAAAFPRIRTATWRSSPMCWMAPWNIGQPRHRLRHPPRRRAAHVRRHRHPPQRVQRLETEPVHFLQIWILPERQGLAPGYEQKSFSQAEKRNTLR